MKILVTGSDGFIGCHLSALLIARGHHVFGLDVNNTPVPSWLKQERISISGLNSIQCDITDLHQLTSIVVQLAPDVVIHLAAKSGVSGAELLPSDYDAINVKGVANLIHACRAANVKRIVHASSSSVYGDSNGVMSETVRPNPIGYYGRTKLRGEQLMAEASTSGSMDVLIIRPFSVIGPRSRPDMAPWRFAEAMLRNEVIPLHVGAGRDFTSVHDVSLAFALAAEANTNGCHVLNVGGGKPHQAMELAEILSKTLQREFVASLLALPPYMPLSTHADISKAKKMLGWQPRLRFEDSVVNFAEWLLGVHPEFHY